MLLKLNKEGPFKKDVFRAPGHQGNMRKLVHFLQQVSDEDLRREEMLLKLIKLTYWLHFFAFMVHLPFHIEQPWVDWYKTLQVFGLPSHLHARILPPMATDCLRGADRASGGLLDRDTHSRVPSVSVAQSEVTASREGSTKALWERVC